MNPRTSLAILAGKTAGALSRISGRGGGTAVAGLAALRIDPRLVGRLTRQAGCGTLAVTGTNGKTTTALMLNRIAREAGLAPLHNRSGSNMARGIAAMLVEEASVAGAVRDASRRIAILEVDEATLPEIARETHPRAIVFTNLFRDQLDRYGEVDAVAASWRQALASARNESPATIVLNADDPAVAHLGRGYAGRVLYYGIDDISAASERVDHASDFRQCLECGAELTYSVTFYGHLGQWHCGNCGNTRPTPSIAVRSVSADGRATALQIDADGAAMRIVLPLAGLYNAYNATAAIAGALAMELPSDAIVRALEGFSAAFGRQEQFEVDGRTVDVLLGKNPTGLNQVLRTISAGGNASRLLFMLSDGIADGRDVSWIWDADFELAAGAAWVMASGTRAEDLALRLKYAGFGSDVPVDRSIPDALARAIEETPEGGRLFVLPTYTAMLEARAWLAKRAGATPFWEEDT